MRLHLRLDAALSASLESFRSELAAEHARLGLGPVSVNDAVKVALRRGMSRVDPDDETGVEKRTGVPKNEYACLGLPRGGPCVLPSGHEGPCEGPASDVLMSQFRAVRDDAVCRARGWAGACVLPAGHVEPCRGPTYADMGLAELRMREWSVDVGEEQNRCPSCNAQTKAGHKAGCRLNQAIVMALVWSGLKPSEAEVRAFDYATLTGAEKAMLRRAPWYSKAKELGLVPTYAGIPIVESPHVEGVVLHAWDEMRAEETHSAPLTPDMPVTSTNTCVIPGRVLVQSHVDEHGVKTTYTVGECEVRFHSGVTTPDAPGRRLVFDEVDGLTVASWLYPDGRKEPASMKKELL